MRVKIVKKSTTVFLAVAILFTTVFSMSIFANAATSFSPRLSAPSSSNKYYYSDINIFYNRVVIDAKSILGVLSLDLSKALTVEYEGYDRALEEILDAKDAAKNTAVA